MYTMSPSLMIYFYLLSQLSVANLSLLIFYLGSSKKSRDGDDSTRQSRPAYPQERRDLYERVSRNAQLPTFRRVTGQGNHEEDANVRSGVVRWGGDGDRIGIDGGGERRSDGRRKSSNTMSFVMLTESQVAQPPPGKLQQENRSTSEHNGKEDAIQGQQERPRTLKTAKTVASDGADSLSEKMETTNKLFEILSSRSDIDHPVCVDCTELLLEGLQKRLSDVSKERDRYLEFMKELNTLIPTDEETEQAEQDLTVAQQAEDRAFAELEELEREKERVDAEIANLELESRDLDKEEQSFWAERNEFKATLDAFHNERERVNAQFDHDVKQLEFLQRTNVYNDTFCIGHDGHFGTINGLRLGRLSSMPVDWTEINAAWGQACLLLATVAEKLEFSFQGYRLNPIGSTSTIDKLEYSQATSTNDPSHPQKTRVTTLELYCAGDLPLGLGFLHRRFDNAMVAFLECLRQLGHYVEQAPTRAGEGRSTVRGLKMPYIISKDKIGDASIKSAGFNQEESWTKACKYTLTCCKYLLAHASNVSMSRNRDG